METEKTIENDILKQAEQLLHYNNLLIEQCNNWLPAEEGNRVMKHQIKERRKKFIIHNS